MQLKILTKVSWLDIDIKEVELPQSRNCSESIDSACSRERIPKTTIDFLSYRESHWTLVLLIDALSHLPTIVVLSHLLGIVSISSFVFFHVHPHTAHIAPQCRIKNCCRQSCSRLSSSSYRPNTHYRATDHSVPVRSANVY